jgi:hypothetical protein
MTPSFLMPPILASKPIGTMCYFLDKIPPELRLEIYRYVVVSDEPLRAPASRGDGEHGLHLAILRVNRQIQDEATALFYSNIFHITSSRSRLSEPEVEDDMNIQDWQRHFVPKVQENDVIHFDPPLRPSKWKLLRHVTIDLSYYPANFEDSNIIKPHGPEVEALPPFRTNKSCSAFANHILALVHAAGPYLVSLHLTSHVEDDSFGPSITDTHSLLAWNMAWEVTLARRLRPERLTYSIEFANARFRMDVPRDMFHKKRNFAFLAAMVHLCRSCPDLWPQPLDLVLHHEDGKTDLVPLMGPFWSKMEQDVKQVDSVFDEQLCERETSVIDRMESFVKFANRIDAVWRFDLVWTKDGYSKAAQAAMELWPESMR